MADSMDDSMANSGTESLQGLMLAFKRCPRCAQQLPAAAVYCSECGRPVPLENEPKSNVGTRSRIPAKTIVARDNKITISAMITAIVITVVVITVFLIWAT